ncbi:hypothetical protein HYX19_00735 [Candidatus Woesearchaeota archaeon]|nr:hypothetical protein [Candidatus Woesearchaeota archaeon]
MDKCRFHARKLTSICNWCGAKICEDCISDAKNKRYCRNCVDKLKIKY